MTFRNTAIVVAALGGACAAIPAAATVGSASLATARSCSAVSDTAVCDGTGPGQQTFSRSYGGGVGIGGLNRLVQDDRNRAWSFVSFDGDLDLPDITAYTTAPGDWRMNINAFAFQSYTWTGETAGLFSLTGSLHIVDSSTSPGGGALPGGAFYTQYVGIWDPSLIAGLTTGQELFDALFYRGCEAGVLGVAQTSGTLTGGEATYNATTTECAAGSLVLTPGQEVLVVAGLQLPVNRGGFADSSATFVTRLADDLTPEQVAAIQESAMSAIADGAIVAGVPEPASWALMIAGFGLVGAAARRRQAALAG